MNPVSFTAGYGFGFLPFIFINSDDRYYDFYLSPLTASEQEAVDRVRDQFHTRSELNAFIKGLRR